jgi:ATP-binding cassette subfamily B protein
MEQYDDNEATRQRVLSNRQVLGFIAGFWRRRRLLLAATVFLYPVAIGLKLMAPPSADST